MSPIRIRPATRDDDAALVAVDTSTWSTLSSPAPVPAAPRSYFAHVDPADVLVAELDGRVVGYTQLHNAVPIPSHGHVLEINGLAVLGDQPLD